jgi:hypothetical protein
MVINIRVKLINKESYKGKVNIALEMAAIILDNLKMAFLMVQVSYLINQTI